MNEYKNLKLTVTSSPHVNSPVSTRQLMLDVLIALVPSLVMAVYFFGPRALVLTLVSVLGCEIFECGYRKLMKKPCAAGDLSAAVTGVLVAFVCPVALPYWTVLIGDFFAIVAVKQLYGGLGKNFLNPALAGRAFLMLSFASFMGKWVKPGTHNWWGITESITNVDTVTAATPLAQLSAGNLPVKDYSGLIDLLVGNVGGCIGEVSAIALMLGGAYLILRGVIHARIPLCYLGTVAVLCLLFPQGNDPVLWTLSQLLSGGLMLGAFFMATDYVSSPCTPKGEMIFGVGCGLLTVFIRYFGGFPEGVSYAILLMNLCVPIIEKFTRPGQFGVTAEMKKAAKAAKKGGDKV